MLKWVQSQFQPFSATTDKVSQVRKPCLQLGNALLLNPFQVDDSRSYTWYVTIRTQSRYINHILMSKHARKLLFERFSLDQWII